MLPVLQVNLSRLTPGALMKTRVTLILVGLVFAIGTLHAATEHAADGCFLCSFCPFC